MERREHDGFEVLDLSGEAEATPAEPGGALPPLDLGTGDERPAPAEPGGSLSAWRRWGAVVAVFLVGVVTGAYVWNARADAATLAAEAAEVSLVAGPVAGGFEPTRDIHRATVSLLNAGPRDVEVLSAFLPRWTAPASRPPREVSIPAGEWVDVSLAVQPSCDAPVPTHLDAQVRTEAGETSASIPLPPRQGLLEAMSRSQCAELAGDVHVVLDRILDFAEPEAGVRRMAVRLWAWWQSTPRIVGVGTSVPGFEVTAPGLPLDAGTGGRIELELYWRIDDCESTESLDEVTIDLDFVTSDGVASLGAALPNRAVAMLARFAAEECNS